MRRTLIVLTVSTMLCACATADADRTEVAAQTEPLSGAASGEVSAAAGPKPQIGSFGFDTAGMDRSVAPGDNFYLFANGSW